MGWLSRFSVGSTPANPALAAGKRIYAVGDIHGRCDLLDDLFKQILAHAEASPPATKSIVFLGDYIDRGPQSKQVIEYLLALSSVLPKDWKLVFLRGNHDQAMLQFLIEPSFYRSWRTFGAQETLLSYGVMPPKFDREPEIEAARTALAEAIPAAHMSFLQKLEYLYVEDDYLFAHAGIRPGLPIEEQLPEDLMWIRDEFLNSRRPLPKMVVHGHTPSDTPVRTSNRIGIDTGAHATHCLTAAVLEGKDCLFLQTQKNFNRMPVNELARA